MLMCEVIERAWFVDDFSDACYFDFMTAFVDYVFVDYDELDVYLFDVCFICVSFFYGDLDCVVVDLYEYLCCWYGFDWIFYAFDSRVDEYEILVCVMCDSFCDVVLCVNVDDWFFVLWFVVIVLCVVM